MDIDNIEVTEEEIAKSYEENKANNPYLSNEVETRDIKYIVKQVVPSEKDLANLKADMTKYADSLRNGYDKYQKLARISRSMVPYNNFLLPKALLDPTVASAIDTLEVNEVLGPVDQTIAVNRDQFINTYDVYMNVEKARWFHQFQKACGFHRPTAPCPWRRPHGSPWRPQPRRRRWRRRYSRTDSARGWGGQPCGWPP